MPAVAGQGRRPPVQCASAGTGCLRVLASGQLETIWAIVILLSHSHDIFLIHLLSLNAITDQAQVRRPERCTGWLAPFSPSHFVDPTQLLPSFCVVHFVDDLEYSMLDWEDLHLFLSL